jgi:hypothetical protein
MTNPLKRFFLFCSGATRGVLNMQGCEVEHNKYTGIGATIFFTATLAALSGGYAMFTVFHDSTVSFAFGLLWGLIIFNLDRFIVSSIRKQRGASKRSELLKALPRLILAVFISIVITRPIELKLFEVEIEGQITKGLAQERTDVENSLKVEYADIETTEKENKELRNRLTELENERNRRIKVASGELEGWGGTANPGEGPIYKQRLAEVKQSEAELNAFQKQYDPILAANDAQLNKRKSERDNKTEAAKKDIDNSRGLLKRLEALSKLTSAHLSIFLASGFIVLLFISLETAPILVKLFSSRGPYDDYLDAIEHQVYATQQKEISDINGWVNTSIALSKQLNADLIKEELKLSRATMSSLQTLAPQEYHDAQVEIAQKAIARWRKGQLNLLNHVAPPATSFSRFAVPVTQTAVPPTAPTPPRNVAQPFSSTVIPAPAAASSVPPPAGSPSNNGGGNHTSIGAAGSQTAAPAAAAHGASSTAQQTSSGAAQQSGTGTATPPTGSHPNTSTP